MQPVHRVRRYSAPASACRRACSLLRPTRSGRARSSSSAATPDSCGLSTTRGAGNRKQRSVVDAYQQLYYGSRHDAAEAMRTVTSELSDDDLAYFRRAAASPGTIETLATVDREIDARHVLPAVHVPTLVVHAVEDETFPVGGARYMAERLPRAKLVEVPGNESLTDRLLDESEHFLQGVWEAGGWEEPEPERVLATILFTDIVGSTERAAVLGDRAWHGSCSVTTSWYGGSSSGSGDVRSTPPATGSSRASMGRRGRSGARRRSSRTCTRWSWRCARVSTQASVSCWTGRWRGSPSTPAPALPPGPSRARCLSRARSRTSSRARGSPSRTEARTS